MPPCAAVLHRAPPRWYVPGVTPRPAKPFVPSSQRKSLRLAVFVKIAHRPIVVRLDEAAVGGQAASSSGSSGSTAGRWDSAIFCRIVEEKLLGDPANRRGRLHGPVKLLLDRDPAHLNQRFKRFALQHGMKVCFLPAKAPDLDPLDYGVFGTVKRAWEQRCFGGPGSNHLSWDERCSLLVEMLLAINPDSHIAALPSRIARCIEAGGAHFKR
jgi:hypothetical protein